MNRTVAIVGAGATAISALSHIVEVPGLERIDIIDPRTPGLGPAFGDPDPALLCNTSLDVTSLFPEGPSDFLHYLWERGWPVTGETFAPRFLVGQYCRERYRLACARAAEQGVLVTHTRDRAIRIRVTSDGYRVGLAHGGSVRASDVLICAGLVTPHTPDLVVPYPGHPDIIDSPYPVARLRALPSDARVLILGTGLSAIDAALVLCAGGRKVTMTSPSGRLPSVRTRLTRTERATLDLSVLGSRRGRDLDRALAGAIVGTLRRTSRGLPLRHQTSVSPEPVARLREEELMARRGLARWQDVISDVIDGVNEHMASWPGPERDDFLARYREPIFRYVSAIPLANARALIAYCDAGELSVAGGFPGHLHRSGKRWRAIWEEDTADFDRVVCATGLQEPSLRTLSPDTLLLQDSGPEPCEEERPEVSPQLRVRLSSDGPEERIWLLGSTCRPRTAIANYLRASAKHARAVRDQWNGGSLIPTLEEPDVRPR
jgi:hypothetical protein